ncbi:MAG: tetratricopeptide repeat protein [Calditrichaceae bacterium]
MFGVFILFILTACRPPELEGAYVDYNAKRIDSALELAKQATEKYPDNAEAPFLLGQIYGEKGMFKEMMESFEKSLNISTDYESKIKETKTYYFNSEYKSAYDSYVSFQKSVGDTSERTIKLLDNAIKHAENASLINPDDYSSVKLAGLAANYKNDTDLAEKQFTKLTKIKPDTVDGWFWLGRLNFNKQNYEKAIEYNKKANEIDETYVPALELIAFSYESLKDTANTIKAYKEAIEADPNNVSYLFNLGLVYNKLAAGSNRDSEEFKTDYSNAELYFSRALNLDPDELDEYQRTLYDSNLELLYSLTCVAQIQQRKFEEAEQTALDGIDNFPGSADLYEYLAISQSNLGKKKEAQEANEKAEQLRGE